MQECCAVLQPPAAFTHAKAAEGYGHMRGQHNWGDEILKQNSFYMRNDSPPLEHCLARVGAGGKVKKQLRLEKPKCRHRPIAESMQTRLTWSAWA